MSAICISWQRLVVHDPTHVIDRVESLLRYVVLLGFGIDTPCVRLQSALARVDSVVVDANRPGLPVLYNRREREALDQGRTRLRRSFVQLLVISPSIH